MEHIIALVVVALVAIIAIAVFINKRQNEKNATKIDKITNNIKQQIAQKREHKPSNFVDRKVGNTGIVNNESLVTPKEVVQAKPMGWIQTKSYEDDIKSINIEKYLNEDNEESTTVAKSSTQDNQHASHDRGANGTPLILLVDDSITVLKYTSNVLVKNGYEVVTKSDGWEAINYLQSPDTAKPDLIISDIEMPKMTGVELIKLIRKEKRFRSIPVLVISAHAQSHLELMEQELIQGFMHKPFNDNDFTTQIQYLLNQ